MTSQRSSKWAFIVYPESAPKQWKEILNLSFIKIAISPLHEPEADENNFKPHYHILMDFDSLKSFDQVSRITSNYNGTIPFIVDNPSGYYQYLIHLNNPEKQQFKDGYDAIEKLNGFNSERFEKYSEKQLDAIYDEIYRIIDKYNITEITTLIEYLSDPEHDMKPFCRLIRKNTIYFNSILASRRNRIKDLTCKSLEDRVKKLEGMINE